MPYSNSNCHCYRYFHGPRLRLLLLLLVLLLVYCYRCCEVASDSDSNVVEVHSGTVLLQRSGPGKVQTEPMVVEVQSTDSSLEARSPPDTLSPIQNARTGSHLVWMRVLPTDSSLHGRMVARLKFQQCFPDGKETSSGSSIFRFGHPKLCARRLPRYLWKSRRFCTGRPNWGMRSCTCAN